MGYITTYTIHELKEFWTMLFPQSQAPADSQWALWFLQHDPGIVREGIVQLATKRRKLNDKMDADYMVKFASAVMNRLTRANTEVHKENHRWNVTT
jgi:hypothetical protein